MKWWVWLIIALVALIVLGIAMHAINRAFRRRYGFSLYGGGFLLLLGVGGLAGGIVLLMGDVTLGYALFILPAVTFLFTLIYDIKKCGGAGIGAFFLQLLFCVPSLLIIFDVLFNKGRSTMNAQMTEYHNDRRRERRARRRQDYDDDYRY